MANKILGEAKALFNSHQYGSATDVLMKCQFEEAEPEQMRLLMLAQNLTLMGSFVMAQEALDRYQRIGGDPALLLLEQLNLHFMSGKYAKWNALISRSLLEIDEDSRRLLLLRLCPNDRISLFKHVEEAGYISEAIDGYVEMRSQSLSEHEYIKVNAQLLRLYSQWGESSKIPALYQNLVLLSLDEIHKDAFVEVNHALLLAEAVLFSPDKALARFQELAQRGLDQFDKKLMLFDLLETLCSRGHSVRAADYLESFQEDYLDAYESSLKSILEGEWDKLKIVPNELTTAGFLRVISLLQKRNGHLAGPYAEVTILLLGQFSGKSKRMWTSRMIFSVPESGAQEVIFEEGTLSLKFDDKKLELRAQPILAKIAGFIAASGGEILLESLCASVLEEEYDLRNQDRLRVHISRLNRLMEKHFSLVRPLKVRSGKLHTELRIRR